METNLIYEKETAVLAVKGDLDYNSYKEFNTCVMGLIDKKTKKTVIVMAGVGHIDSMGLGAITKLWKIADENGLLLMLAEVPKNIQKMIKLINLDRRIQIFDTVRQATG